MSDNVIIGVDHGYAAMKSAHFSFPTGLVEYEYEPYTRKDVLELDGRYYVVGTGRQPLQKDKTAGINIPASTEKGRPKGGGTVRPNYAHTYKTCIYSLKRKSAPWRVASVIVASPDDPARAPRLSGHCAVYGRVMGDVHLLGSAVVISGEEVCSTTPDGLILDGKTRTVVRPAVSTPI